MWVKKMRYICKLKRRAGSIGEIGLLGDWVIGLLGDWVIGLLGDWEPNKEPRAFGECPGYPTGSRGGTHGVSALPVRRPVGIENRENSN